MSSPDSAPHDLQARLAQAEALLAALRSGEVDAVISQSAVLLLCVQVVEAALREGEARYRLLFEHSGDAILLTVTDGRILMANPAACRLFGWTADELAHMREEVLVNHADPKTMAVWAARARAGEFQAELTYVRRDGSTFSGETSWAAFGEQNGEKKSTVIIRDVTERKRAEEAVLKAQAELARITRAMTVGELTVSVAHEINQPLGAIVNNGSACLRLLQQTAGPAEARDALADIIEDARRASGIVARIRALTSRSTSEKTSVQINDVIADVLSLAGCALVEHHITVRTELAENLPRAWGDRVDLQQLLLNLVVNGIEAMDAVPDERRILTIGGRRDELDGKPAVLVTVRDLGPGFKPGDNERLFDAFYTTKLDGLGMGLRIGRSIVEAHGGRLWATSGAGPGATFYCALPAE
jgi:PAS domain S-box-containing protein